MLTTMPRWQNILSSSLNLLHSSNKEEEERRRTIRHLCAYSQLVSVIGRSSFLMPITYYVLFFFLPCCHFLLHLYVLVLLHASPYCYTQYSCSSSCIIRSNKYNIIISIIIICYFIFLQNEWTDSTSCIPTPGLDKQFNLTRKPQK